MTKVTSREVRKVVKAWKAFRGLVDGEYMGEYYGGPYKPGVVYQVRHRKYLDLEEIGKVKYLTGFHAFAEKEAAEYWAKVHIDADGLGPSAVLPVVLMNVRTTGEESLGCIPRKVFVGRKMMITG